MRHLTHFVQVIVGADGTLRLAGPVSNKCDCARRLAAMSRCKRCSARSSRGPCADHGGDSMPERAVRVLVGPDGASHELNVAAALADSPGGGPHWMSAE